MLVDANDYTGWISNTVLLYARELCSNLKINHSGKEYLKDEYITESLLYSRV